MKPFDYVMALVSIVVGLVPANMEGVADTYVHFMGVSRWSTSCSTCGRRLASSAASIEPVSAGVA